MLGNNALGIGIIISLAFFLSYLFEAFRRIVKGESFPKKDLWEISFVYFIKFLVYTRILAILLPILWISTKNLYATVIPLIVYLVIFFDLPRNLKEKGLKKFFRAH